MKQMIPIFIVLCLSMPPTAVSQQEADPWQPLRALLGTWAGTGSGFGTVSEVVHEWEFVIGQHFLRLSTRSTSRAAEGSQEVHEDIGYLSLDADRDAFVFRQFLSEGYVNTYDVTVDGNDLPTIEFAYLDAESAGGMRAQMRLVFVSADQYEMVLDLAGPESRSWSVRR